jgi:hypothetical protein
MPGNVMLFSAGLLAIVVLIAIVIIANTIIDAKQGPAAANFDTRRLYFAAVVLTGLAVIFLEAMAMYYWGCDGSVTAAAAAAGKACSSEAAKDIFDACKTVVPPIVTLVLGFYFGKAEQAPRGHRGGKGEPTGASPTDGAAGAR